MRTAQLSRDRGRTRATRDLGARPAPKRLSAFGSDGVVLGRYRLGAPLGTGAFASVWSAVDERLEREVAVKIIPQRRVMGARFEREARAAARLSHPAIVTLYEAVAEGDVAYLVSELVRGLTLEEALEAGRLSDREIVTIGMALCDALAYAHGAGIIHRDVKPSNILVPTNPPSATPPAKLTDFGVAHAIGGDSLTHTGDVIGTAAYMAPEQAAGRQARAAADLYSLALVLYEGLAGINPLASVGASQRATRLGLYLPPLRRQRRELPRELGCAIDQALRPRPGERGTLADLCAGLESSLPEMADEKGVVAEPWRPRRRWRSSEESEGFDAGWEPDKRHARTRATERRTRTVVDEGRSWLRKPPQRETRPPDPAQPGASRQLPSAELPPLPQRAAAAALGAVVTAWLAAHVLAPAPLAPAAAALAAAAVLLALPRLGFVFVALGLALIASIQGHSGEALVIGVCALVPIALNPRGDPPWPLAGGAPLLGAVGLAGCWPALAARAGSIWGRATLGAVGWVWVALAGPLAGGQAYVTLPAGAPPLELWGSSSSDALHHVLGAAISSGALAPALVWALAAVALPNLVSDRSLLMDATRVAVWSGVLVVCTALAISLTGAPGAHANLHNVVLGAVGAALVAIAPTAIAALRDRLAGYPEAGLP